MVSPLKLVATPLGNLRDISLRALDEIQRADVIFAEDTRHSTQLINALGIKLKPGCRLISCDAHKEEKRIALVIEKLRACENVVMISDAGCPAISDPGSLLVQGVIAQGLDVEVIPGPSAVTAAIMGAGINTTRFAFLGFLPQRKSVRHRLVKQAANAGLAIVIYESPMRVADLLSDLNHALGPRRVVVARELTKLYETFHRGVLGSTLSPPLVEKGECVVIVEADKKAVIENAVEPVEDKAAFVRRRLKENLPTKEIAQEVALLFAMKKTDAYDLVQEIKKSSADHNG